MTARPAPRVRETDDPAEVLDRAGSFLATDPVRHNVILTLLAARVAFPDPGRYWMAAEGERVVGVALQSPTTFFATVTPMTAEIASAVADAVVDAGATLPGVNGEAATAARFAGQWSERTKSAAFPDQGQRIYEVDEVRPAAGVDGDLRVARPDERDLLVEWFQAFERETGECLSPAATAAVVDRRLNAGQLWVWEDGGDAVSLAGVSAPVSGVSRVGPVYTPPSLRGRGYASAVVAGVSRRVREGGYRCILYTDLGNPTSNSVYRALGYRAVAEAIRYRFSS